MNIYYKDTSNACLEIFTNPVYCLCYLFGNSMNVFYIIYDWNQ